MIDLYSWLTPNGDKVHVMLEETRLAYQAHPVNISEGEQFKPKFLKISPNNRIPAIVDRDGPGGKPYALFESGAILMYLAEKTGKFWPKRKAARYEVVQWVMFQMGNIGPMMGQAHHFRKYAPKKIRYGIDRYTKETRRLFGVVDKRLKTREYLAGPYSIADMACWPWVLPYGRLGYQIEEFPHLQRWFEAIRARPAVERGFELAQEERKPPGPIDEQTKKILFGQGAPERE